MSYSSSTGFTLIELLVVIVIMMTMFSFVSPLGIEQVNRAKSQQELHETIRIFQTLSSQAYASGSIISIELNNSRIVASYSGKVKTWQFENIHFPVQNLMINRNGFLDHSIISYRLTSDIEQLNMMSKVISNTDAYIYAP